MRKIGFKLRVMRLNCVESFYAFLLLFRSEGSPYKGQPGIATASRLVGAVGHQQGGGRLQPTPPVKGATDCGQAPCKGGHPQWLQPRVHEAARGQAAGGGCPLQGRKRQPRGQGYRLQGRPLAGSTACPRGATRGQQHRHLRRAAAA
ncbi:hypothetical protein BHE74_00052420 [Ensete ventricosum]|nr:hypothetical protein BHE74_00052420 [Ensete ventricosum]